MSDHPATEKALLKLDIEQGVISKETIEAQLQVRYVGASAVPPLETWGTFQKKVPTRAVRMEGPFTIRTSEGPLTCEDGWLAMDARGYPYPIAADEFDLIYEAVPDAS